MTGEKTDTAEELADAAGIDAELVRDGDESVRYLSETMTQNNNPWKHAEIRYAVFPEGWMRSRDVRPEADCETRHRAVGTAAIMSRENPREYVVHPYPAMTVGRAP